MTSKEIDSGSPRRGEIPRNFKASQMTPSEARERGREAADARISALKSKLPNYYFKVVERTPALYQGRLAKALLGEVSPKNAIRAKCEECVGYEEVKSRVGGCTSYSCPVHTYRPYQAKGLEDGAS